MSDERQRSVQRQAKALGDPTRHAIFRAVTDAAGPIDVATLTARFELHHNAIRQHLAKLCAAGRRPCPTPKIPSTASRSSPPIEGSSRAGWNGESPWISCSTIARSR